MFEITIESSFSAAHAILVQGDREPLHGHNWHVQATVAGPALDPDGLLIDFHLLERLLADIITPFHNRTLNDLPPFDRLNPTAENVAGHIAHALERHLADRHPPILSPRMGADRAGVPIPQLLSVRVTEAPGCAVTYRPALSRPG